MKKEVYSTGVLQKSFYERNVLMRRLRRFNIKLIGLALLASSIVTVVPAALPQTTIAAEAEETYDIYRKINFIYKNADGTTSLAGSASQSASVSGPDVKCTFPSVKVSDLFEGNLSQWKPDKETIPSVEATYNSPPPEVPVYLSLNTDDYISEKKTVQRTINYYVLNSDGTKSTYGNYKDSVTFGAGSSKKEKYTFKDITLTPPVGYLSEQSVVKGRTVTPESASFSEDVIYSRRSDIKTEKKTVWRKVNFIEKATGKKIAGSQSQGAVFSREVFSDNGKTVVVKDWQKEATIKEFTVPAITGYTAETGKVPASKVTVDTKDFEIDVFYKKDVSVFTGVRKDTDGIWRIYKNNKVNSDYNGLMAGTDGNIYYFTKGVWNTTYTNKLAKYSDGKWYFIKKGVVDTSFTGLGQSPNGRWYYVKNGVLDKTYNNKLARSSVNGKWYFVKNGILDKSFTGLGQSPNGKWYYVKNGLLDKTYTGLAVSSANGYLYYARNGILDKSFNGTVEYEGKRYSVINGRAR